MHCPDIYDISIVNIDIQIGNVKAACRLQPETLCLIAFLKKLIYHCVYTQRTANSEQRTANGLKQVHDMSDLLAACSLPLSARKAYLKTPLSIVCIRSEKRAAHGEQRTAISAPRYSFPAASSTSSSTPAMIR